LLGAGFRPRATLLRVAGVEATTLLGGFAGVLFLAGVSRIWLAAIVAHAGGGFLFLALHAAFGEIFRNHKPLVLISFASGSA